MTVVGTFLPCQSCQPMSDFRGKAVVPQEISETAELDPGRVKTREHSIQL